jgi:hypothetical protein
LAESLCDSPSIPLRFELVDGRTIETSGSFQREIDDQEAEAVQEDSLLQIVKGIRN